MAKTLLLLGASSDHLDVIRSLRAAGYRVITADPDTSAPAHARADISIFSISAESLLAVAKKERVAGIIAPFSSGAAPVVAQVSAKLKLPAIPLQAAQIMASKVRFRDYLTELQMPHPQTHLIKPGTSLPASIFDDKQWILKPDIAGGGRGLAYIASSSGLKKAMGLTLAASITGVALLERYLLGQHCLCQILVRGGTIQRSWFIDRIITEPPAIATTGYRSPSKLAHYPRKLATQLLQQLCESMNITDGCLLAEFVVSENQVHILELAPKLPGRGALELVRLSAGVDLAACAGAIAAGETPDLRPEDDNRAWGLVFLGPSSPGMLKFDLAEAEKLAEEKWIRDLRWFVPQDSVIEQGSPLLFAAGRIFVSGRDRDAVDARVAEVYRRLHIRSV